MISGGLFVDSIAEAIGGETFGGIILGDVVLSNILSYLVRISPNVLNE